MSNTICAAWREGNSQRLEELPVLPRLQASVADRNIILAYRSALWVPKIVVLFDTPGVELVLVGVSHLIGDDSVLVLLADMGFQVSRY